MPSQTRREFSKLALLALPTAGLLSSLTSLRGAESAPAMPAAGGRKPNSKINGIHIGMNAPYNYGNLATTGPEVLARTLELNVSALELRSGPVEAFMGAPGGGGRGGGAARGGIAGATPAQNASIAAATAELATLQAAFTAAQNDLIASSLRQPVNSNEISTKAQALATAELRLANGRADAVAKLQSSPDKLNAEQLVAFQQQNGAPRGGRGAAAAGAPAPGAPLSEIARWRASASMDKAREFRKIYEDAGVFIEIMKFDGMPAFTNDELEYAFTLAAACGARAISLEMPGNEATKRIGAVADRHKMMVGYHNHASPDNLPEWLTAFEQSKYNGANVDIGHYVAGAVGGDAFKSPLDFLKKYPERVTHVHIKDRKANMGPNMPFGQGDTPIVEVLRAMRDNKWQIQATIEFEYPVPAGSDRMTEIAKSIAYCRNVLAT
jgi:sugar phosphate isomerase/epimerase